MASAALTIRLVNTCCSSPSQPITCTGSDGGFQQTSMRRLEMRSLSRSRVSLTSGASVTGFGSVSRLRANSRRLLTIRAARKVCRSTFFRIS